MKMSRRSLLLFGIGVFFAAGLMTMLLRQAEAEGLKDRARIKTAALSAAAANVGPAAVVINELDADTPGTDAAEFIELKAAPGTSLNGYVLVFYSGSDDLSYFALDLDGVTTDSNGFAVAGNTGIPGVDATFGGNLLQNGQDAVGLYLGDATSFPNGTAVTAANLVDAVVYDTNDADDSGLLTTLLVAEGQVQINEAEAGPSDANSVRRCSDAARDGRAFSVGPPTPNAVNSNCPDGIVDIDGDGKTDYLIIRPMSEAATATDASVSFRNLLSAPRRDRVKMRAEALQSSSAIGGGIPLAWWGLNSSNFSVSTAQWGEFPTDSPLTADFDGDGKDDFTVFRPGDAGSYWYSIDSSTFTTRQVLFGGPSDYPYVVGDYDGDGIDDPAVFRCPELNPGPCYFFYRPSSIPNPGDWAVQWGFGDLFSVLPFRGDFNGDGKLDFAVQQQSPTNPANGIFYIALNGTFEFSAVEWGGWPDDRIIPGDFDGDGKSDITVARFDGNDVLWWYTLERDGGTRFVPWGNWPDLPVPGDYDGDGRDDVAIYRDNSTDATYWVLPSNGASHFAVTWGRPLDIPLQNVFLP